MTKIFTIPVLFAIEAENLEQAMRRMYHWKSSLSTYVPRGCKGIKITKPEQLPDMKDAGLLLIPGPKEVK